MANVTNSRGEFDDLGRFKSKKCRKISIGNRTSTICELRFTEGKIVISQDELNKVCKK